MILDQQYLAYNFIEKVFSDEMPDVLNGRRNMVRQMPWILRN